MIKKKNIIGILTILSAISLGVLGSLLLSQGINFSSFLVQLGIVNLTLLAVFSGIYLVNNHCEPKNSTRKIVWILGALLSIFGCIVAFNILHFSSYWAYLVGAGLIFITIVQMQILDWEQSKGILKVLGLLTLVANIYIIAFFIFKLTPESMAKLFDIAVLVSTFAFLVGLIFYCPKKSNSELD